MIHFATPTADGSFGFSGNRPAGLPTRETRRDIEAELERFDQQRNRTNPTRLGGVGLGRLALIGARVHGRIPGNGGELLRMLLPVGATLSHDHAMQSIELFTSEVMPHYTKQATTQAL